MISANKSGQKTSISTKKSKLKKYQKNILTSFILGVFFVNSSQPIKVVDAAHVSAPRTVNYKVEKIPDYDKYNNDVRQVIRRDTSYSVNKITHEPTALQTPNIKKSGSISNLISDYQNKILNALKLKNGSEATVISMVTNSYATFRDAIQRAYASEPFGSGSIALLFNETTYIKLRRDAQNSREKNRKQAQKNKLNTLELLKENLSKTLKNLKTQFEKKRIAKINRLNALKKSQISRIKNIRKNLRSIPNQIADIQRKLKERLGTAKYYDQKASENKSASKHYKKEYEHAKKKYKKYKKKYKKKHKSKYKKRYKKYKKRYKKNKSLYKTHRNRYNWYHDKKDAAYRDYHNLLNQLQSLKNSKHVLRSQLTTTESRKRNTINELSQQPASIEDISKYHEVVNQTKQNYANQVIVTEEKYEDDLKNTEEVYNSNLQKAEVYKNVMHNLKDSAQYFTIESQLIGQERLKYEIALRDWIASETKKQKKLARRRIENRKKIAQQVAQTVFAGTVKGPKKLLDSFERTLHSLQGEMHKMQGKVKKLKEAYEENADYKKKMKKYKKKYKKYSKKAKKHKGNKKKYKKYENKREHARKKYEKYKKKYEKYNSLKKAYKSGYEQGKDIYKQFEGQYNSLVKQKNDLQRSYKKTYTQASKFKKDLLKQSELDYAQSKKQLRLAETMDEYSLISTSNNDDIKGYLKFIPATSTYSLGHISFKGGLDALSDIKKGLKKMRSKAKKSYGKYLKKIKKQEEKRQQQLRAIQAQKNAWYRHQANLKAQKQKEWNMQQKHTVYDKFGNGFSTAYPERYDTSSFSKYAGYGSAIASTGMSIISSTYKPKKIKDSWLSKTWDKTKNWFKNNKPKISGLTMNVVKTFPPTAIPYYGSKAIGWMKDRWYNDYKQQDTFGKWRKSLDLGGDVLGTASGFLYLTGIGAPIALGLDVVGGIMDAASAVMYAMDGDWKNAAWKTASIIPGIGSGLAVLRRGGKISKIGIKALQETAAMAKIREKYAPFAKASRQIIESKNSTDLAKALAGLPKGFEIVTSTRLIKKLGFKDGSEMLEELQNSKSVLFYNKNTGESILSPAGTNPLSLADWKANMFNWVGIDTPQHAAGRAIGDIINADKIKNLILAGHSKGGGIDSLIGAMTGLPTYVFNSAGLRKSVLTRAKVIDDQFDNIHSFVNNGDLLNATQIRPDSILSKISPNPIGQIIKFGDTVPNTYTIWAKLGQLLRGISEHSKF